MLLAEPIDYDVATKYKDVITAMQHAHKSDTLEQDIKTQLNVTQSTFEVLAIIDEIKRLGRECSKVIDLRHKDCDKPIFECRIAAMTHFLDAYSKTVFKKELAAYNGIYTVAVNEKVEAVFAKREKAQDIKKTGDIETIQLGLVNNRNEERMNVKIPVDVYIYHNENQLPEIYSSKIVDPSIERKRLKTSNISLTGLLLEGESNIPEKSLVVVRFNSEDIDIPLSETFVLYECMRSYYQNNKALSALKLVKCDKNEKFITESKQFIDINKVKFGIDIRNTFRSALTKTFEQITLDRAKLLSFYYDKKGICHYTMGNKYARNTTKHLGVKNTSPLYDYLASTWLDNSLTNSVAFIYITHKDGKMLAIPVGVSKEDTYAYGVIKKQHKGKLYHISKSKISHNVATRSSATPIAAQQLVATNRFQKVSPTLDDEVEKLDVIYTMFAVPALDYHNTIEGEYLVDHDDYIIAESHTEHPTVHVETSIAEQRIEDRFNITSPVTIVFEGKSHKGTLDNISSFGAKINCPTLSDIKINNTIEVSFVTHATKIDIISLSNCKYKVVNTTGDFLHCSNAHLKKHAARRYWDAYLECKVDKLKAEGRDDHVYGIRKALTTIAVASNPNLQVFYTDSDANPKPSAIAASMAFSKRWSGLNLTRINDILENNENPEMLNMVVARLKSTKGTFVNFLTIIATIEVDEKLITKVLLETDTPKSFARVQALISLLLSKGFTVQVFSACASKRDKVNFRQFYDEVSYIHFHAKKKFESIRDSVVSTAGMFSITDVTTLFINNFRN